MAAASSDGGPTGGRGPPIVLEFLVINFSVCFVLSKLKNAERHNQELAESQHFGVSVGSISYTVITYCCISMIFATH